MIFLSFGKLKPSSDQLQFVDQRILGKVFSPVCKIYLSDVFGKFIPKLTLIKIQAYCAIIACMLITLCTGKKPTLRTHEMICWYLLGVASEEELLAHIEKLKKQNQ